jgi:hypothetical protein
MPEAAPPPEAPPARPPVVEATLVDTPTPDAADEARRQRAERSAARAIQARAERRQRLFSVFFRHQAGTRREKMAAAYALLDAVRDPDEYALLRILLRTLQSVHDSCPPTDEPTP